MKNELIHSYLFTLIHILLAWVGSSLFSPARNGVACAAPEDRDLVRASGHATVARAHARADGLGLAADALRALASPDGPRGDQGHL